MGFLVYLSFGLLGCQVVSSFMDGFYAASCNFPDWLSYQGHCYGFFPEEQTWEDAHHSCKNFRSRLASIENHQVHDTLINLLTRLGTNKDVWIKSPYSETTSRISVDFCPVLAKALGFKHMKYMRCVNALPFLCESDHL